MYLRCNTYTWVKGGYVGRGTLATGSVYLYPLPAYSGRLLVPSIVLRPGPTWPSYLSRPPMGVVPSSNGDYGLHRGRYSPRAPRTRILYLPEKILGLARRTRVLVHRVRSGRTGSLLERIAPFFERHAAFKGRSRANIFSQGPRFTTSFSAFRSKVFEHPIACVVCI